jgi:hypothetical protein
VQSGIQLVEVERLYEVIVGSGFQALDPITHLVAGGDDDDR